MEGKLIKVFAIISSRRYRDGLCFDEICEHIDRRKVDAKPFIRAFMNSRAAEDLAVEDLKNAARNRLSEVKQR